MGRALLAFELRRWGAAPWWPIGLALLGALAFAVMRLAVISPMMIPTLLLASVALGALSTIGPIGLWELGLPWAYLASRGVGRSWLRWIAAAFACVVVTAGVSFGALSMDRDDPGNERSLPLHAEVARTAERRVAATGGQLLVHDVQGPAQAVATRLRPPDLVEVELPGAISFMRWGAGVAFLMGLLLVAPQTLRSRAAGGRMTAAVLGLVVFLFMVSPTASALLPEAQRESVTGIALVGLAWAIEHGPELSGVAALMILAAAAVSARQWRKGDLR